MIADRLRDLGIVLPAPFPPAGSYLACVVDEGIVHVSGHGPIDAETMVTGKVGADLDVAAGAEAAKTCAIALLAQLKAACGGDLDRVVRAVKLVGFVNSTPDFTDQPKVINGASDFLVAAMGDAGRHARSAVSAGALPLGVAVEIEAIFEIR